MTVSTSTVKRPVALGRLVPFLAVLLGVSTVSVPEIRAQDDFDSEALSPDFQNASEVRQAAQRILASPEFAKLRRTGGETAADEETEQPDDEKKSSNAPPSSIRVPRIGGLVSSVFGALFHALAWIILVAVCALIIFLIVKGVGAFERSSSDKLTGDAQTEEDAEIGMAAPGELPVDFYLSRALQLAQQREHRDAMAHLLLGAMCRIERSGRIRYRRGLTLRDYLRAVRASNRQRDSFGQMIRLYEPISFGRREATEEHFQLSLAGYESGFEQENPTSQD